MTNLITAATKVTTTTTLFLWICKSEAFPSYSLKEIFGSTRQHIFFIPSDSRLKSSVPPARDELSAQTDNSVHNRLTIVLICCSL